MFFLRVDDCSCCKGWVLYAHVVLTCDPFVCYRQLAE
jgi:hypothetical protein